MGNRIQKKPASPKAVPAHHGHRRAKLPEKPVVIPEPPTNAIPEPESKPYEDVVICYLSKNRMEPYAKKREWEKYLTPKWSGMFIQQYNKDFTLDAYRQAYGEPGQVLYESVRTLCEIALQGDSSSRAMSPLFNMISGALFSTLASPAHQPISVKQFTPEKVKQITQDFEKAERNRKPNQNHNPAAWKALNDSFASYGFPAMAVIEETGGMDALCIKRYAQKKDR